MSLRLFSFFICISFFSEKLAARGYIVPIELGQDGGYQLAVLDKPIGGSDLSLVEYNFNKYLEKNNCVYQYRFSKIVCPVGVQSFNVRFFSNANEVKMRGDRFFLVTY